GRKVDAGARRIGHVEAEDAAVVAVDEDLAGQGARRPQELRRPDLAHRIEDGLAEGGGVVEASAPAARLRRERGRLARVARAEEHVVARARPAQPQGAPHPAAADDPDLHGPHVRRPGRWIHASFSGMLGRSSGRGDGLDEPTPDPLSSVLPDLRLSGGSYGRCELDSPWGLEFAPQELARFHFVVAGRCWLRAPELGTVALEAGDVVLLPRGTGHTLAHAPRARTKPIDSFPLEEIGERAFALREGGAGARALLACCSVRFQGGAVHPLL